MHGLFSSSGAHCEPETQQVDHSACSLDAGQSTGGLHNSDVLRTKKYTACANFITSVARHPLAAMQWYRLLLLATYGLATAHALLCIVSGDESAVFFSFLVPGDLDLRTRARFLYSVPNRQV